MNFTKVVQEKTEIVYGGEIMATRDLGSCCTSKSKKKKNPHTGIPDLVKATRNVTAADASAVNAGLEYFNYKNGRQGSSCSTDIPSHVKE